MVLARFPRLQAVALRAGAETEATHGVRDAPAARCQLGVGDHAIALDDGIVVRDELGNAFLEEPEMDLHG